MKRTLVSLLLILVGSGLWWSLSQTARFSGRAWERKFENIMRKTLSDSGVKDADVLASVHEVIRSMEGEWIAHQMTIRLPELKKQKNLERAFLEAGAQVYYEQADGPVMVVSRQGRVYQKIRFTR